MVVVRLYATLRPRAGGERAVEVPWSPGDRVRDTLQALLSRKPALEGAILDQDGRVLPYVNVFLEGRDIRYLSGLETPVEERAEISVFPAVAGG